MQIIVNEFEPENKEEEELKDICQKLGLISITLTPSTLYIDLGSQAADIKA